MACQWQTCQFWCLVENGNQFAWCWTKASHSLITNMQVSSPTEVILLAGQLDQLLLAQNVPCPKTMKMPCAVLEELDCLCSLNRLQIWFHATHSDKGTNKNQN